MPKKALLVVFALVVLLVVGSLSIGAVSAQDEPDPERHAAACPDLNPMWEGEARGDLETNLFEISTQQFVVTYEILDLEVGMTMPTLYASVEDEQGRDVSSGKIPGPVPGGPLMEQLRPNMGRYVVNAPPGSYRLDINSSRLEWRDWRYAVTVEECGTA